MPRLQEVIHALEEGVGAKYLRLFALLLGVATMAVVYDLREFQNLRSEEAMDAAQVARNLAEGRGFTTRCIRPLSMGVLVRHGATRDAQVKGEHPDLVNPPLYPLLLAAFMKVPALFEHQIVSLRETQFRRHQPDFLIAFINQGLFFIAIALSWRLAHRLFDARVALLTALMLFGSDVLWQFSVSGQGTMLAMAILMALANVLQTLDARSRQEPRAGLRLDIPLAALAGLLCALLLLTRYSLGILVIPVLVFLAAGPAERRIALPTIALIVFIGAIAPWLVRNWNVCGNPFGLAPYSLVQETSTFSGNWLERVTEPEISKVTSSEIVRKCFVGAALLVREELPRLGGNWLTAFFLVGFLVPFVDPVRARLRWFAAGGLLSLAVAQILSRTHLSVDTPEFNSENLLVLMTPLVLMFGAAMLTLLVASLDLSAEIWRRVLLGIIVVVLWLPMIITLGPPRTSPVAFPPYYPPTIQRVSQWFQPGELIMTDMPWAVAWYGDRQALLLSENPDKSFIDLSDWQKTINGLYLSRLTLDERFLSGWVLNARKWGKFVIDLITEKKVPPGFPLRQAPSFLSMFPEYLLIADRIRWQPVGSATPSTGLTPAGTPGATGEGKKAEVEP